MTLTPERKKITEMVIKMASNTYLLPVGWGEKLPFTNRDGFYRTYSNESRDYISIESLTSEDRVDVSFTILLKDNEVEINVTVSAFMPSRAKRKAIKQLRLIEDIFNEMHCFNSNLTPIKKIRQEIIQQKQAISTSKNVIKNLYKQIEDAKNLIS